MRKPKETDLLTAKIEETEKALEELTAKREGADPDGLVQIDNEEKELKALLNVYQRMKATRETGVNTAPAVKPGKALTTHAQGYIDKHAAKVEQIEQDIASRKEYIAELDQAIAEAIKAADPEKAAQLHKKKADMEAALQYTYPILEAAKAEKVFPEGVIFDEWQKICEAKRAEYEKAVSDLEVIADGYKAALTNLNAAYNELISARYSLERMANEDGEKVQFATVIHNGQNVTALLKRLAISDNDTKALGIIFRPGYIL